MTSWKRYAIYYTATDELADFCASWLGWDITKGCNRTHPAIAGLTFDRISVITQIPRRYGFHATLKPPFRLNSDTSAVALRDDVARLAMTLPPVSLPDGLHLASPHGFPALIPAIQSDALTTLASTLVRGLDHHRAPLSPHDRARRNPERLTVQQRANLDQWGYPWVMEEFRFHMTLGGTLAEPEAADLLATLKPIITPLLPYPHVIDSVTLIGEDEDGYCHQIKRFALTG